MEPYRVLVVDDSAFMRKIISDLIQGDPQFVVIGTATNGIEAVAAVESLKPDVVTLDLEMPLMNGIDALQHILKKHKLPIIMLSGISEANTRDTIKALQFGAFDFIRKPTSVGAQAQDISAVGEMLLEKLKIAILTRRSTKKTSLNPIQSKNDHKFVPKNPEIHQNKFKNDKIDSKKKSRLLSNDIKNLSQEKHNEVEREIDRFPDKVHNKLAKPLQPQNKNISKQEKVYSNEIKQIVAIGTSTGGPRALHEVITALPGDLKAPVVIVQHMPPRFTNSLAQRLDSFSDIKVVEAQDGMALENGIGYIAPGGFHMEVTQENGKYQIKLSNGQARNGHRPSVDHLFESLVPLNELERHVVIMTGMGSDGAQGMKQLFDHGAKTTIAEAEESCVVYGMPRSAIELGAAQKVLPLTQIASEIIQAVMK